MLYIDNTYISSLEELKAIIESHAKDKSSKKQDEFRTELIETFEDKTDTGLTAFVNSLQTEEARKYARQLLEIASYWVTMSTSEQYNALVAFFNITTDEVDIMKYIEKPLISIQEGEDKIKVSVDVKVIIPVNEYIQFEFALYDENNQQLGKVVTEKQSIAVPINQIIHFEKQLNNTESVDKVQVTMNQKVIEEHSIGKILLFSVGGVEFKMIRVKGGKFMMGSDTGNYDEQPIHEVELSDFYIAETPVTQELWKAVTGENPSFYNGYAYGECLSRPVEHISWDDCNKFLAILNEKLKLRIVGKCFDLPSEAQWEFAARGGTNHDNYKYSGDNKIRGVAWYDVNSNAYCTEEVKKKRPNSLELYDMSGNVWEFCKDIYKADFYSMSYGLDPVNIEGNEKCHVKRGGSCRNSFYDCRVTCRAQQAGAERHTGMRLVLRKNK